MNFGDYFTNISGNGFNQEAFKLRGDEEWSFDFHHGTTSSFRETKLNIISTKKYNISNFFPQILIYFFARRWINFFIFIISIIMVVRSEITPYPEWIYFVPLFSSLLIYMIKELYLDFKRKANDDFTNNLTTTRGKREKGGLEESRVKWKDLEIGDVIHLKSEEACPADIIILDTNEVVMKEAICHIDTYLLNGKTDLTQKKASSLTQILRRNHQKNSFANYRKILTGKIDYEPPNGDYEKFFALFKLKRDPQVEKLTIDNFIPRGAIIRHTGWLFGLVIYTGKDTKIQMNWNYKMNKSSFYESISNAFFIFTLVCIILGTMISVVIFLAQSKNELASYNLERIGEKYTEPFLPFLIMYSTMTPVFLYFILDIIVILSQYLMQKTYRRKKSNDVVNIRDPNPFTNIGQVEYVFLDKTGTLTKKNFSPEIVYFNKKLYSLNSEKYIELIKKKSGSRTIESKQSINGNSPENRTNEQMNNLFKSFFNPANEKVNRIAEPDEHINFSSEEELESPVKGSKSPGKLNDKKLPSIDQNFEKEPNAKEVYNPVDKIYSEEDFLNLMNTSCDDSCDLLLESIVLTQNCKVTYLPQKDEYIYDCLTKEEEACLFLANKSEFIFERYEQTTDLFHVIFRGKKLRYKVLAMNPFSHERGTLSSIIRHPLDSDTNSKMNSVLFCRGISHNMKNYLNLDPIDMDAFEKVLDYMHKNGCKPIVYTRKILSPKITSAFLLKHKSLSSCLISDKNKFEKLSEKIESNLELVGVIGLKHEIADGAPQIVQFFKNTNLKMWMVTGDSKENAMNTAINLKMISNRKQTFLISEENNKDLVIVIRNILEDIKNALKPQTLLFTNSQKKNEPLPDQEKVFEDLSQHCLIVNGESLNIIFSNSYLKSHFIFIASIIKNGIGYNLTSEHKKLLVKMIQIHFPDSPTVMAVGDGYNDIPMMQSADISIEMLSAINKDSNNNEFMGFANAGDIQINKLKLIQDLMIYYGRIKTDRQENIIYFSFYISYLLALHIFFFNWYSKFVATSILTGLEVFLYNCIFSIPNIIVYGLFDMPFRRKILRKFPALYLDGALRKSQYMKIFALKVIVEASLQSVLIFFNTANILNDSLSVDGNSSDVKMINLNILLSLIFIINVEILFICIRHRVWKVGFSFPLTIIAIIIYVYSIPSSYNIEFSESFLRLPNTLCFFYNIIGGCLISFFMNSVVNSKLINLLYNKYILYPNQKTPITNQVILAEKKAIISLSRNIKKIFKNTDYMDSFVYDILTRADSKINDMKLNKYNLKIMDKSLNKKYKISQKKSMIVLARIYFVFLLLIFFLYTITDFLVNRDEVSGYSKLGIIIFFLMCFLFTFTDYYQHIYQNFILFVICLAVFVKIVLDWNSSSFIMILNTVLVSFLSSCTLNIDIVKIFLMNFIHIISFCIRLIVLVKDTSLLQEISKAQDGDLIKFYLLFASLILMIFVTLVSLYYNYKIEREKRNEFLTRAKDDFEIQIRQEILSILVPKFVKDQLNQGNRTMQQNQDMVVILFCDICEFDKMITVEGTKIVQLLDSLFRAFDGFCLKYGAQKIETVGKTYMAASGIKECEIGVSEEILRTEKTRRLVLLALEMKNYTDNFTFGKGEKIKIKIGVHIGKVIAGVIGYHKPQFSLIGDTVNTTSRVCSTGDEGHVTISEDAHKKLKGSDLSFIPKVVSAKGKGDLTTYQVSQKHGLEGKLKKKMESAINMIKKIKKAENVNEEKMETSKIKVNQAVALIVNIYQTANNSAQPNPHDVNEHNEGKESMLQESIKKAGKNNEEEKLLGEISNMFTDKTKKVQEHEVINRELLVPHKFFLTIPKSQKILYKQFQSTLREKYLMIGKYSLFFLTLVYLIETLIISNAKIYSDYMIVILILRGIFNFLILLTPIIYLQANWKETYTYLILSFFIFGIMTNAIETYYLLYKDLHVIKLVELILISFVYVNLHLFLFIYIIGLTFGMVLGWIVIQIKADIFSIEYLCVFFTFLFFELLYTYSTLSYYLQEHNNLVVNDSKKEEQESLVSQLLPYHVFDKLKNTNIENRLELTDHFSDVTILFADIAGFTKYSSSVQPEDVVNMLRNLFTEFDKMCIQYKIYKVYTIGDCYVVISFINSNKRDPIQEAKNMIKMGFSMIEIIRNVRKIVNFKDLDMRIGLHTGEFIGGIIGTDIVRYDIYGKDVLIANKMESNGIVGNVMVSETTKKILEKDKNLEYKFEWTKEVICKGCDKPISAYLIVQEDKNNDEAQLGLN